MKNTIQSWAAKYIQLYTYYTRKYISKTIVTCLYKYTHDISNYYIHIQSNSCRQYTSCHTLFGRDGRLDLFRCSSSVA